MRKLTDHDSQEVKALLDQIPRKVLGPWILSQSLTTQGGPLVQTFNGHTGKVWAVAVTPDGRLEVSGSFDRTIKVWDIESGRVMAEFTGKSAIYSHALSADGRTAVAGEDSGRVHLVRLENFDARSP